MLIATFFFACAPAGPTTGALEIVAFDCDAGCWAASTIEVPREFWSSWLDADACDDGSVTLNYDSTCVQTSNFCESAAGQADRFDDPAVGEVADCCGGLTTEEQEALQAAPMCEE